VPFPPGGPVDTTARGITGKLAEMWGQAVIVENRAGAGGIVGAGRRGQIARRRLHRLRVQHPPLGAAGPESQARPYDIEQDFVPITFGASFPIILVAHESCR
jgi:tripartite-type tricarboxylate transporter receptor subunit TctC